MGYHVTVIFQFGKMCICHRVWSSTPFLLVVRCSSSTLTVRSLSFCLPQGGGIAQFLVFLSALVLGPCWGEPVKSQPRKSWRQGGARVGLAPVAVHSRRGPSTAVSPAEGRAQTSGWNPRQTAGSEIRRCPLFSSPHPTPTSGSWGISAAAENRVPPAVPSQAATLRPPGRRKWSLAEEASSASKLVPVPPPCAWLPTDALPGPSPAGGVRQAHDSGDRGPAKVSPPAFFLVEIFCLLRCSVQRKFCSVMTDSAIGPRAPALQAVYCLSRQGSPWTASYCN